MRRWRNPAGLAERYGKKIQVVLANPFEFFDTVYDTVERIVAREELAGLENLSFHRTASHPLVSRRAAHSAPSWNSSNAEITVTGQHAVWVIFDSEGRLAFRGRATFEEIEALVARLMRGR